MNKSAVGKTLFLPPKTMVSQTLYSVQQVNAPAKNDNMKIWRDHGSNIMYIDSMANQTVIKTGNGDVILGLDGISFSGHINTNGNVSATNGDFGGDVNANNISLIGDLTSTNANITSNINIDKTATMDRLEVQTNAQINNLLMAKDINASNIQIDNLLTSKLIQTDMVYGACGCINIPNIRYTINISNLPLINADIIKKSKVFIVDHNLILNADETCDGIEIIIFNKHITSKIIIRDQKQIICSLDPQQANKIVYLFLVNKWTVV